MHYEDPTGPVDVCVIGGGFAGLSVAYYLKQQRLSCRVLERNPRLAEKTKTLLRGRDPIELGTCFTSVSYARVFDIARQLDVPRERMGTNTSAQPCSLAVPFYKSRLHGLYYFIKNGLGIARYLWLRHDTIRKFEAGDNETVASASRPLKTWLGSNSLSGLSPLFTLLGDGYGYGPVDQVPAIYLLRFVNPGLLQSLVTRRYWRLVTFEEVINRLGDAVGAEVGKPVTAASDDPTAGVWRVKAGDEAIAARHVVVACPPNAPDMLRLFEPERRTPLANGLRHSPYMCAAVQASNWYTGNRRLHIDQVGQRDRLATSRRDTDVVDGKATYCCFATLSDPASATPEKIVRDGITRDGAQLQSIIEIGLYPTYNTHFSEASLREGAYDVVAKAQGRNRLWIANSCLAHENWRDLSELAARIAAGIADALRDEKANAPNWLIRTRSPAMPAINGGTGSHASTD